MKYGIWTSPKLINEELMKAWNQKRGDDNIVIILFFKAKGSGLFCGVAELISDYIEE